MLSNKINLPSVSIITITQYDRINSLKILFDLIQSQTYSNIQEWIIVEGSSTLEKSASNLKLMAEFLETKDYSICIKIISFTEIKLLGELRNLGNNECTSDIIVCMDDDDYYPPTRVQHAVEMLNVHYSDSDYLISGSSILYIYDFFLDKLYKYNSNGAFGPYHSTNNCMAFKRKYLYTNLHDKNAKNAEERSFTKNFTNKMVALDPLQTIICISHSSNTFNKRNLCIGGSLGIFKYMLEINEPITNYIPENIYNMMKNTYYKTEDDGPFTIEHLLKTNNKNIHFLEKYKNKGFNF